jgi:large subunit ribosomal protein L9
LKVILTRDYEKLGNTGDIVNVKDGFAKNFLIPNNIAVIATGGNINQMEIVKKSLTKKEAKNIEEAQKVAEVIDGIELRFMVNSSPDGKLYGSITNKDIADMILEDKKIEIDRKKIELEEHIKEVGNYEIEVRLYKEVKAVIKVEVASDDVVKEEGEANKVETPASESDREEIVAKPGGDSPVEDKTAKDKLEKKKSKGEKPAGDKSRQAAPVAEKKPAAEGSPGDEPADDSRKEEKQEK